MYMKRQKKRANLELPLGELILLILAFIGFVFVGKEVITIFFSTPTNQEIAEKNAEEIINFVKFSEEESSDSCFSLLKLRNLENFQFKEDENFLLVIRKEGIELYPYELHDAFISGGLSAVSGISSVKFFEFENEVELKKDETSEGNRALWITWISPDSSIELEEAEFEAILLEPKFSKQFGKIEASDSSNFLEGQNTYIVHFLEADDSERMGESSFLALRTSGSSSELFFTEHRLSQRYAQEGLCSLSALRKAGNDDLSEGVSLS